MLENGEQNAQGAPKAGKRHPKISPNIPGYTWCFSLVVLFLHSIISSPLCLSYFTAVNIAIYSLTDGSVKWWLHACTVPCGLCCLTLFRVTVVSVIMDSASFHLFFRLSSNVHSPLFINWIYIHQRIFLKRRVIIAKHNLRTCRVCISAFFMTDAYTKYIRVT